MGKTIGILASWMEGPFLGNILIAIHEGARQRGYHTVFICTALQSPLDRDLPHDRLIEIPPGEAQIAGWVVVGDALSEQCMRRLGLSGKPIVTTCRSIDEHYPVVLADNVGGVAAATEHLLDHGHTRIAFVGSMYMSEMQARYAGYCSALRSRGIEPDPRLLIDVEHCWVPDGAIAAERLLDLSLPCSALIAGNDQLALGLLPVIQQAGVRVPQDLAIIGFDDINEVQYLDPPLSSVSQKSYALGLGAIDLLLKQLDGASVDPGLHTVPTKLITRQSCGCTPVDPSDLRWAITPPNEQPWIERLEHDLVRMALYPAEPNPQIPPRQVWPGLHDLSAALEAAIVGTPPPPVEALARAWEHALALTTNLKVLYSMVDLLSQTGAAQLAEAPNPPEARARLEALVQRLRFEMFQSRVAVETYHSMLFAAAARSTSLIHAGLLRNSESTPRDMQWLKWTDLRWGCLAMRQSARRSPTPELTLVGAYSRDPGALPALEERIAWEAFNPTHILEQRGAAEPYDLPIVVAFETSTGAGGVIVMLETVDSRFLQRYSAICEWMFILTVALDREGLLGSLAEQQEQLSVAKRAAEDANEQKTKFLAAMSHELRTPLNAILNFSYFIGDRELDHVLSDEQRHMQQRILSNADHLLGLINDILDLSKIEAGKMELYQEQVDLLPLLQSVMSTAIGLTREKGLSLELDLPDALPRVWIDKTRIRQVLLNMLSNAAKFTVQGSITLRARGPLPANLAHPAPALAERAEQAAAPSAEAPEACAFIKVSVQDTGIGIPLEQQHLVFEEFRQIGQPGLHEQHGTGLGMPISRRFIELHGGRMWLESTPSLGTTFSFTIPVAATAG